jgi:hypothetical protein
MTTRTCLTIVPTQGHTRDIPGKFKNLRALFRNIFNDERVLVVKEIDNVKVYCEEKGNFRNSLAFEALGNNFTGNVYVLHNRKNDWFSQKLKEIERSVTKPARVKCAYAFFNAEVHRNNKNTGKSFNDINSHASESWKLMTDRDKKKYLDLETQDKARFDLEMQKYRQINRGAPKNPRSAYLFFRQNDTESNWKDLSETERVKYTEMASQDHVRYQKEMVEFEKWCTEHGKDVNVLVGKKRKKVESTKKRKTEEVEEKKSGEKQVEKKPKKNTAKKVSVKKETKKTVDKVPGKKKRKTGV